MFKKILFLTDFSDVSRKAVEYIKQLENVMTVMVDMIAGEEDLTVVECMKGKEVEGRNGIRNKVKKGKQEQCAVIRGYS
jgi:hypothetical protein